MKDIKFNERSLFSIHDPHGVKNTNLDNLKECVSPMCGYGLEIDPTQHFFSFVAIFIMLEDWNSLMASTT